MRIKMKYDFIEVIRNSKDIPSDPQLDSNINKQLESIKIVFEKTYKKHIYNWKPNNSSKFKRTVIWHGNKKSRDSDKIQIDFLSGFESNSYNNNLIGIDKDTIILITQCYFRHCKCSGDDIKKMEKLFSNGYSNIGGKLIRRVNGKYSNQGILYSKYTDYICNNEINYNKMNDWFQNSIHYLKQLLSSKEINIMTDYKF